LLHRFTPPLQAAGRAMPCAILFRFAAIYNPRELVYNDFSAEMTVPIKKTMFWKPEGFFSSVKKAKNEKI
jgi:hypothetical protein